MSEYRPLTEQQMTAVQMRTVDPDLAIGGVPVPALTTLLYQVCGKDAEKFEEACRLVGLFIEQARKEDRQ